MNENERNKRVLIFYILRKRSGGGNGIEGSTYVANLPLNFSRRRGGREAVLAISSERLVKGEG